MNKVENEYFLILNKLNERIKLIVSKCCVCDCLLNFKKSIQTNSKTFCASCYREAYKCEWCSKEILDQNYFTFSHRVYCQHCLDKIFT